MAKNLPEFVKYDRTLNGGTFLSLEDPSRLGKSLHEEVYIFEKGDGGNCQVRVQDWQILPGSKANYLKGVEIGRHPWFKKFLEWVYSNSTLYKLPSNLIMFGEWLGNHTIKYDPLNVDCFYVLDVLDLNEGRFVQYDLAEKLLQDNGIEDLRFFPIQAKGRVTVSEVERILFEPSNFYPGEKEGIVVKNYRSPQTFFRIYHPEHSERVEAGKKNLLTPSRVSRAVHRIMDQKVSNMASFNEVVEEVIRDVMRDGGDLMSRDLVRRRVGYYLKNGALGEAGNYVL